MSPKGETASSATRTRAPSRSGRRAAPKKNVPDWQVYTETVDLPPVLFHSLEAFVANGYHATSVRDVSRRLGQTVPAIYYYYENKQALLMALLSLSIDDLLERCQAAAAEHAGDPVARFDAIVRCIVLYSANRRKFALLDAEIRGLEPDNRAEYVAKRDRVDALLTRSVNDGINAGLFAKGDSHAVSRAILAMCRGVASWYRADGPLSPTKIADLYVGYSLRLVGYPEV
jgi:AcrR family transcriptional regulator